MSKRKAPTKKKTANHRHYEFVLPLYTEDDRTLAAVLDQLEGQRRLSAWIRFVLAAAVREPSMRPRPSSLLSPEGLIEPWPKWLRRPNADDQAQPAAPADDQEPRYEPIDE